MGYTTEFVGKFKLDKPLTAAHKAYLLAFAKSRRNTRNEDDLQSIPDPIRTAAGLPVGDDGEYFVGNDEKSIINHNAPPRSQPGLWCQWIPNKDGSAIVWDEGEKFYDYVEWIVYLVRNFLEPWGYKVNGEVKWWGEERSDYGIISIKNNHVSTREK